MNSELSHVEKALGEMERRAQYGNAADKAADALQVVVACLADAMPYVIDVLKAWAGKQV